MIKESDENLGYAIIRDPNLFSSLRREYDPVRTLLLSNIVGGQDYLYTLIDKREVGRVLDKIQTLFEDRGDGCSGRHIHLAVYEPFSFKEGFTRKIEHLPGRMGEGIIDASELNSEQRSKWEKYLHSVEFVKQKRMLIAKGVRKIPFPSIKTKNESQNVLLAAELEKAKRNIVNRLIPNIRDEEAMIALGSGYSAEIMRSKVILEWF